MELVNLWYKFSAKWIKCKTLVKGWTQLPLPSNTNMMLFLLYLQMSDTVFSPNGNEDAHDIFAHNVFYDALVPIIVMLAL